MKKRDIVTGVGVACLVALALSPFASSWPDGLEKVAEDKGFLARQGGKNVFAALVPDYLFPGIRDERLATAVAGVSGTLLLFVLSFGMGILLRGRKKGQA